jgi:hypothetical protein
MDREPVAEAYRNGATLRQIGEVYGVSPGTVRNVLIEMGVEMRPRGRRKRAEAKDPRILPVAEPVPAPVSTATDSTNTTVNPPETYEGGVF